MLPGLLALVLTPVWAPSLLPSALPCRPLAAAAIKAAGCFKVWAVLGEAAASLEESMWQTPKPALMAVEHQGERFGAASLAALSARPPLETAEAATARAAALTARAACGSQCWAPLGPPADGVRGFPAASLACLSPWLPLMGSSVPFLLCVWAAGAACAGPDCRNLAWEVRACLACGWGLGSSLRWRFLAVVTMPPLQAKHPEDAAMLHSNGPVEAINLPLASRQPASATLCCVYRGASAYGAESVDLSLLSWIHE